MSTKQVTKSEVTKEKLTSKIVEKLGKMVKMNKSGGITIPSALRRAWKMNPGTDQFQVTRGENGEIILLPYTHRCMICGATNYDTQVIHLSHGCICAECTKEASEKLYNSEQNLIGEKKDEVVETADVQPATESKTKTENIAGKGKNTKRGSGKGKTGIKTGDLVK